MVPKSLIASRRITDQHSTAGRAPSRVGITRTVPPGRSVAVRGYPAFLRNSQFNAEVRATLPELQPRFSVPERPQQQRHFRGHVEVVFGPLLMPSVQNRSVLL